MDTYLKYTNNEIEHVEIFERPPQDMNPDDYIKNGYLLLVEHTLDEKTGYLIIDKEYIKTDTTLEHYYKYVKAPELVRTFSKYKMIEFMVKEKRWNTIKSFLQQSEYYDLFINATEIREDNEFFKEGVNILLSKTLVTQKLLDECLEYSVI